MKRAIDDFRVKLKFLLNAIMNLFDFYKFTVEEH